MMNMFFEIMQLGMITVVLYDGNFYLTCLSTHSSGTETETIDTNIIIIDPTVLLNTDIDNIRLEFNRLLKNLREKTKEIPATDVKAINGL